MLGKIQGFSEKPPTVFRFFSVFKPLSTFQRIYPDYYPGTIWYNLEASGKSLRNVDSGTATVNRF